MQQSQTAKEAFDEKPRKSTPGHGGKRPGAGRPKNTGKHDAYTELAIAKAKREKYRADLEELKYKETAGALVPIVDYERELADALKTVAMMLESLPDVLERDAGLDGPAVERCQQVIDQMREDLYAKLANE